MSIAVASHRIVATGQDTYVGLRREDAAAQKHLTKTERAAWGKSSGSWRRWRTGQAALPMGVVGVIPVRWASGGVGALSLCSPHPVMLQLEAVCVRRRKP